MMKRNHEARTSTLEYLIGLALARRGGGSRTAGSAGYVIFRPGVPSAGQAVATWAEVQTALTVGAVEVIVDSTLAAAHIPAGSHTNLTGIKLAGFTQDGAAPPTLHIDDTADVANLTHVTDNLQLVCACTTTPALVYTRTFSRILVDNIAGLLMGPGATVPAFKVPNAAFFEPVISVNAQLIGAGGVPVFGCAAGGTLILFAFSAANYNPGNATLIGVQTDVGGTLLIATDDTMLSDPPVSADITYSPLAHDQQQVYGQGAAFPTTNLRIGQPFFRTDLNAEFRWNGSTWTSAGTVARVVSPNAISTFSAAGFTPGTGLGSILFAIDITPNQSGLIAVDCDVIVTPDASDQPTFSAFTLAPLTAITGGTAIAPGLTGSPTSTTPAADTGTLADVSGASVASTGATSVSMSFTVQAVQGQRTLIAVMGASTSGGTTWTVHGTARALEQPN